MGDRLAGKRVLVTHADRFMGAPVAERFREEGADVVADTSIPRSAADGEAIVEAAGAVDVVFANDSTIISGGDDFTVWLWRDGTGELLGRHLGKVTDLEVSFVDRKAVKRIGALGDV